MKYILLILIFISLKISSQTDYPRIVTDSTGNRIVLMTLEQAQILDNKTDLLPLYEKMATQIGIIDSSCLKLLQEKDNTISSQEKLLKNQSSLILGKNNEIINLNLQISNYKSTEETYKKELENKNKEIDLHIEKINKNKGKLLISGGIGFFIGLVTGVMINR